MLEVVKYILATQITQLKPEMFSFEVEVDTDNTEVKPYDEIILDLSRGQERMPIPVVIGLDNDVSVPKPFRYMVERKFLVDEKRDKESGKDSASAAALAAAESSLGEREVLSVFCKCKDFCLKADTCACRRETVKNTQTVNNPKGWPKAGYVYGRLHYQWVTGVYECNPNCKCEPQCGNRVTQHGVTVPMQVFLTAKTGWGVRVMEDVPKGAFIANYVGFVKDPLVDEANPLSTKYLHDLDLDLLEVIDRLEGLPKKVLRPKPLEFPALETSKNNRGATITNKMIKLEPGEVKREPDLNEGSSGRNNEVVLDELLSTREQIFGRRLPFYVDSYQAGNVARFFNHSCDPTMFPQNVFTTTHNLQFHQIAFFAFRNLKAGTELSYDYCLPDAEEADHHEDSITSCLCGASNCNGRIF